MLHPRALRARRSTRVAALACSSLLLAAACADATSPSPTAAPRAPSFAKGAPGGGGGTTPPPPPPSTTPAPAPSGGSQLPPPMKVDGPAWFFSEIGGIAGPFTADINFDAMQNQTLGGISVGASRTATELVYNVSKKTALTITAIAVVGANPGDFTVPAADRAAAPTTVLPANKDAIELLHVIFSPTAEGLRTATLQVTSAAGVAQVFLRGTGLAQRPIIAPFGPLDFLAESAPTNITIQNLGGQSLSLNSITIAGATPSAFVFTAANNGFSNCFVGELLAPKSLCFMAVGVVPSAAPARATLVIRTNDPVTPTLNVPLTLSP